MLERKRNFVALSSLPKFYFIFIKSRRCWPPNLISHLLNQSFLQFLSTILFTTMAFSVEISLLSQKITNVASHHIRIFLVVANYMLLIVLFVCFCVGWYFMFAWLNSQYYCHFRATRSCFYASVGNESCPGCFCCGWFVRCP